MTPTPALSAKATEVLIALVETGPLLVRDLPNKEGKMELTLRGMCTEICQDAMMGAWAANRIGVEHYKLIFPNPDGSPSQSINDARAARALRRVLPRLMSFGKEYRNGFVAIKR